MKCCVVPGCKSSSKYNISFFRPPLEPHKRKHWSSILKVQLQTNQAICELHFNETDIERRKVFKGVDSSVYQSVPLHRIRLKGSANPLSDPVPHIFEQESYAENPLHDEEASVQFFKSLQKQNLQLPGLWTKIVPEAGDYLVFALFTLTGIGILHPLKEIRISPSSQATYYCSRKKVSYAGFQSKLENIDHIVEAIVKFDECSVCKGIHGLKKVDQVYKDAQGTFRHKLCIMVLTKGQEHCEYCK